MLPGCKLTSDECRIISWCQLILMIHHDFNMTPLLFPSIGSMGFVCANAPDDDVFHFGHAVVDTDTYFILFSYKVILTCKLASWNTHLNTNGANLIIWWVDGVMTRLVESVDSVWWDCVCGIYGITACDTSLSLEVNLPRRSTPTACASTSCRQGKCFVEAAVAYINLYSSAIKTEFYARHFIRE